jgi:hypothetical protein
MKVARIVLFCLVVGEACAVCAQQDKPDPYAQRRVVTTTRLVAVFADLENQWLKAQQRKDKPALSRLLGEVFQVWMPSVSGPVPREEWQQQALAHQLTLFHFRQMAARSLNEATVVASFVLSESVQSGGKTIAKDHFVVDIWSKQDDQWVCTDRYISPLSSGQAAAADVKPSGKR